MADLTVVIPLHNAASYIERTLEAISAQTDPPEEVIVIDDASTDSGGDIARAFRFPNGSSSNVVRHERPLGVAVSRNHGAFLARTEWVGFCDDDDLWHPVRVETIFNVAARHPDLGAIGTEAIGFALEKDRMALSGHQRLAMVDHWAPDDRLDTLTALTGKLTGSQRVFRFEDFQQDTCMVTTTACFRRELYAVAGGNATWSPSLGDWVTNATVAALSPIVIIEDPLVFYRIRASSQSHCDEKLAWGALAILLGLRYGREPDQRAAGSIYRHMIHVGAHSGFRARDVLALALLGDIGLRETAAQLKASLRRRRTSM